MEPEEIILQAAVHGEHAGVYCLGPDVGRVSFVSQQYRALNLVWALARQKAFGPGDRIAIVGAGLSGLTAATACLAYDAHVTVFDAGVIEVPRQDSTTIRYIHPKINWWPSRDDDTLNPTTDLPFLNWHCNNCADVVRQVKDTWDKLKTVYGTDLCLRFRHRMERISNAYHDRQPILHFSNGDGEAFKLVILAVGFGQEKPHPEGDAFKDIFQTSQYWENDNLEHERNQNERQNFIVSGFGDGGLIDVMRLAFKSNSGYLAYELALELEHPILKPELGRLIADDGSDVLTGYRELARKICFAREDYQKAGEEERLRLQPYLGASDLVHQRIMPIRVPFIYAVDFKFRHPCYGEAAPIYKLMSCIIELLDVAIFHRGKVTCLAADAGGRRRKTSRASEIYIDYEDEAGTPRRLNFEIARTRVIVRHGAEAAIKAFMSEKTYSTTAGAKERAKLYNFKPAWRKPGDSKDPYIVPRGLGSRYADLPSYVEKHYERALTALKMLNFQGWLMAIVEKYVVIGHKPHYRPSHLYGVEVDYRGLNDIRSLRIDD